MRANRDGKAVVPGNGGYDIEVVEVTGPPDRMMAMPPAKSRGRLIPMGTGEDLPDRPSPVLARGPSARRKKRSKTPLIPTREEVQSLPRWAKVAFAARCARRVLQAVPAGGVKNLRAPQTLGDAVRCAEQFAGRTSVTRGPADTDYAAAQATRQEVLALTEQAEGIAESIAGAAGAAVYHAIDARGDYATRASYGAGAVAASHAARVIFETATIDTPLTAQLRCIRRDFVRLKRLAREQKWNDDTPVPPDVFGPLWPEGVEPYWAVEPAPPQQ